MDVRGTTTLTGASLRAVKLHKMAKELRKPEKINKNFVEISFFRLKLLECPLTDSITEYTSVPRLVEMNDVNIGEGNAIVHSFIKMGDIVQDIAAPIANI